MFLKYPRKFPTLKIPPSIQIELDSSKCFFMDTTWIVGPLGQVIISKQFQKSISGKVLSYIQGTDSKSSGNAFLNVVQKRDFQGSTGEDHFVIKNEIFEISQEDGVFEIEIEQDNHSYFEEINPR